MTSTRTHSVNFKDTQRVERHGLAGRADGIELKLTVPESHHRTATTGLGPEFYSRPLTENGG